MPQSKESLICPFVERTIRNGLTLGLTCAGYDITLNNTIVFGPHESRLEAEYFQLGVSYEHFHMPNDLLGEVKDKSTWIRQGLTVGNTVIEPGWHGYLTLELFYHKRQRLVIDAGTPIAQIIFQSLDDNTEKPYTGKYQDQDSLGPTQAKFEGKK